MDTNNKSIIEHFQQVLNKILFLRKKDLFEYKGMKIYPSEIHLMLLIKEKIATNITKMAKQLGVTKGAISQTLSKLESKGVLTKSIDPYKKNEITLTFTRYGKDVFDNYSKHAKVLYKKHERYLKKFTKDEKEVIQRYLIGVESVFDDIG